MSFKHTLATQVRVATGPSIHECGVTPTSKLDLTVCVHLVVETSIRASLKRSGSSQSQLSVALVASQAQVGLQHPRALAASLAPRRINESTPGKQESPPCRARLRPGESASVARWSGMLCGVHLGKEERRSRFKCCQTTAHGTPCAGTARHSPGLPLLLPDPVVLPANALRNQKHYMFLVGLLFDCSLISNRLAVSCCASQVEAVIPLT